LNSELGPADIVIGGDSPTIEQGVEESVEEAGAAEKEVEVLKAFKVRSHLQQELIGERQETCG
jgi:hypothetical protein